VIVEWKHYLERPADLVDVLRSGGVFYGGLIAATVVAIVYMRKHDLPEHMAIRSDAGMPLPDTSATATPSRVSESAKRS
jgi:prolipoprotein diacylglyceryltransferase